MSKIPVPAAPTSLIIFGATIIVALTLGFGAHLWSDYKSQLAATRQTTEKLELALDQHAQAVIDDLDGALTSAVTDLRPSAIPKKPDPADVHEILKRDVEAHKRVRSMIFLDVDGRLIGDSRSPATKVISFADREHFIGGRDHGDKEMFIGTPVKSRVTGDWLLPASRRLSYPDGTFAGVVTAAVPLSLFRDFFDSLRTGEHALICLARTDGIVLALGPGERYLGESFSSTPFFKEYLPRVLVGTFQRTRVIDGVERIISYRKLRSWPLVSFVGIALDDALAAWHREVRVQAAIWLLCVTIVAGFTALLARHDLSRASAERAAREAQRQFERLVANVPGVVFQRVLEPNGMVRYTFMSDYAEEMFGYRPEEIVRNFSLLHSATRPEHRGPFLKELERSAASLTPSEMEVEIARPNGECRWVHTKSVPERLPSGEVVWDGLAMDITDRRCMEDALRQSEDRFRALVENSNDVTVVIQPDGIVKYRCPSMSDRLGYSPQEIVGVQLLDLVHPEDLEAVSETLRTIGAKPGMRATGCSRLRHRDGSWRDLAWSARNATHIPGVDGIIISSHDVTDARHLEAQLFQAQKLEAIGRLAGGIAHDFNNILGAIVGFGDFLVQDLPKGSRERGFAERIVKASERAKELIQQILAVSRRSSVERAPIDLGQIVLETKELLRASIPSSTELDLLIADQVLVANVNAAQVSQILLNLCLNANDALSGGPGRVEIELTRVPPGDFEHSLLPVAWQEHNDGAAHAAHRIMAGTIDPTQTYARLTVTDTGTGIDGLALPHIFEPFFTTKERGRGTGLGLAIVHGIVMSYGGACRVLSRPGRGTVFAIYLPVLDASPVPATICSERVRGSGKILVVDDEADLTEVSRIGLERLGYDVVAVNDPDEALQLFAKDPARWDAVISDQVMPRMKGLTLLSRLKAIQPAIPVLLCTGFGDDVSEDTALAAGVDAFMVKPISPEQLGARIRQLIDRPQDSTGTNGTRPDKWMNDTSGSPPNPRAPGPSADSWYSGGR
jgi:PAS domain S-box-containing protein